MAEPLQQKPDRRKMLGRASSWAMLAGLVGGYGALAAIAGRFLFPSRPARRAWMFVTEVDRMRVGDSLLYRGPSGETVNITRQQRDGTKTDFIALSSTCPHLGCQVHWEAHNDRFFCPCHNGAFDPAGRGIAGPPGDAGLDLPRYPLKVERGLLHIELPVESLTTVDAGRVIDHIEGIHGPGHDPCLVPVERTPTDGRA
jgi:Rieske Fe-S protein